MSKYNTPEARWQHRNEFKKVDPLPVGSSYFNLPDYFQVDLVCRHWGTGEVVGTGTLTFKLSTLGIPPVYEIVQKDLNEGGQQIKIADLWTKEKILSERKLGSLKYFRAMKDPEHIIPII